MTRFKQGGALSSRDPSVRVIAVRLPSDLLAAVDETCKQHGLTNSEFLRELVHAWAYGKSQLQSPSDGYHQARSMATRLAHAAINNALDALPETQEGASRMLGEYYNRKEPGKRG